MLALGAGVLYRDWLASQVRAAIVLSVALEAPVLMWTVAALTDEPLVTEARLAGQPATVVRPGAGGPWPALVFVNGATPLGHTHPDVQRLARGLGRAGFLVAVPELPGLRRGEITVRTARATVGVVGAVARRPDVRQGRVGLLGVSAGTTLALLAAEHPTLARRVSVVAGLAPFADMRKVVMLATTDYYPAPRGRIRYAADPFLALAVGRSLAASLPPGRDRRRLVAALAPIDDEARDPLAVVRRSRWLRLGGAGRALVRLLANRDPRRFTRLYAALPPGLRFDIRRLSPIRGARRLQAPVELASAPRDSYFPLAESDSVVHAAPEARLTVTRTLEHAIPAVSLRDLRHLLRLDGFVVRVLAKASE